MALDEKLIEEMSKIAGMYDTVHNYEGASLDERSASLGPFTQFAAESEDHLRDIAMELENSDDVSRFKKMKGFLSGRVARNEGAYNSSLDEITEEVVNKFNEDLEEATNPYEAASNIAYAFAQLGKKKDLSQSEADEIKASELSQFYGVNFTHVKGADVKEASARAYSLAVRNQAMEYIVEEESGDKKEYRIDEEKIRKLVEEPLIGSVLYTAEKPREKGE